MVTDATTQKLRDLVAYGLLAVAALYFLSGLSLLFKSEQDSGLSFTGRAGVFGHVFTHPLLVLALFGAVALAVGFGERSKNARVILIAALAIAALSLLFGLITWLSGFGADEFYGLSYGGVPGAGKLVGILVGLANLLLLSLAAFFAFTALRALPKTAKGTAANSWAQGPSNHGNLIRSTADRKPATPHRLTLGHNLASGNSSRLTSGGSRRRDSRRRDSKGNSNNGDRDRRKITVNRSTAPGSMVHKTPRDIRPQAMASTITPLSSSRPSTTHTTHSRTSRYPAPPKCTM